MKYKSEDYFSVIQTKTGKKICDCSDEMDALMMVSFDPANRTITRNQFLMGQVIDIEMPKALPTNEIVINKKEDAYPQTNEKQQLPLHQNKLPESELQPLNL